MVSDHGATQRFQSFLNQYHGKKLVVLELGIGWRTGGDFICSPGGESTMNISGKETSNMKLGIIRCMQTEYYCPGSRDFKTIRERKGAFSGVDDIELVGFINCGGCPGKKAVLRAKSLVSQGADTIAFASCIQKGTPIGYPCPFAKRMKDLVQKAVGDQVQILDYTHDAGPEQD